MAFIPWAAHIARAEPQWATEPHAATVEFPVHLEEDPTSPGEVSMGNLMLIFYRIFMESNG